MARPRPVAPPVTTATLPFIPAVPVFAGWGRGAKAEPEERPRGPEAKYSGSCGSYGMRRLACRGQRKPMARGGRREHANLPTVVGAGPRGELGRRLSATSARTLRV